MTLLVAGTGKSGAWMVADTAITGPTMGTREREYQIKVEPIHGAALVGFAGDPVIARKVIRAAAGMPQGRNTVAYLLQEHISHPETDFMYAYIEHDIPHLVRISGGNAVQTNVAHIGSLDSFSKFQALKHARELNPIPDALEIFMAGVVGDSDSASNEDPQLHEDLISAIISLQKLFYKSSAREVGGTAIPYLLTKGGARIYGYGYSSTDPGVNALHPGALVAHGSPQLGGYGVSVTELRERDGIAIYWLQRPGGTVWLRSRDWYECHNFSGSPTTFKNAARTALGREIDVWFGDDAPRSPESIRILRDQLGRPRLTLSQAGRALSFNWIQSTNDDFSIVSSGMPVSLADDVKDKLMNKKISIESGDDKKTARLTLLGNSTNEASAELSAAELDALIEHLAQVRSEMIPQVKPELEDGTALRAIADPAWRTRQIAHHSHDGELLALRHTGLGWVAFLLPRHEANALGKYLSRLDPSRNAENKQKE